MKDKPKKTRPNYTKGRGGKEPRKDSRSPRVNYDNTRETKFNKDIEKAVNSGKVQPNNNDVDWYSKNPRLLAQAGMYPVASVVGTPINEKTGSQVRTVPGIMSFNWAPSIGPDAIAITQAANSMYSFDVHANSRNGSYDAPDLMISILAGIDVFNIIGSMIRAYGLAKTYMEQNLYMPNEALRLMGFDPSTLQPILGKAIFDLNWLIAQTRQLWIPNTMPIADKQFKMNSLVFKDADTDRAQVYFFNQMVYRAFSGTEVETGSALIPVSLDKNGHPTIKPPLVHSDFAPGNNLGSGQVQVYSWTTWVEVAQFMIDQLVSMQDRGIMYGDILKAWGADKIRALPEIDLNYTVVPQYNAEVQTQIENIVISHHYQDIIFQNNGFIYPNWNSWTTGKLDLPAERKPLLNFHVNEITAADIVIATRFVTAGTTIRTVTALEKGATSYTVTSDERIFPSVCPTEIVISIQYSTYRDDLDNPAYVFELDQFSTIEAAASTSGLDSVTRLQVMAFDWHPFIYDINATETDVVNLYGDFDNYTLMDISALVNLNRACLFSLLDVPIM